MLTARQPRLGAYLAILALAMSFVPIGGQAASTTLASQTFTTDTYQANAQVAINPTTKIDLFRGALTAPTSVTLATKKQSFPALPSYAKLIGSMYQLKVLNQASWPAGLSPAAFLTLPAMPNSMWSRKIWMYEPVTKKWRSLNTTIYSGRQIAVARPTLPNAIYAVLEDRRTQTGIASWYCRHHCSSRYPALHGTSNDFPIGSMVTVKSLERNASVRVKIVSRWGQPAGRVIDLSYAAFEKIRGVNGGLAWVTVTSVTAPAPSVQASTVTIAAPDPAANFQVTKKNDSPYPGSSAFAYSVLDEATGTVLAEKMSTTPRSIASVTKLLTAAVALDAQINLKKWIIYSSTDNTPYGYWRLKPGDVVSNQDLLNSMLVGSANNAATALARSTGLSRSEFLRRMNEKAKSLGASQTRLVDLHGLDANNKSTTTDLAKIASKLFVSYPLIRQATSRASYDFTTRNTKVAHHIVTTDKLLLNGPMPASLKFAGGKTGFTDEAAYTYVARFTAPNGAKIIVTILGAPTANVRYGDAAALAGWAWNAYTWSG